MRELRIVFGRAGGVVRLVCPVVPSVSLVHSVFCLARPVVCLAYPDMPSVRLAHSVCEAARKVASIDPY